MFLSSPLFFFGRACVAVKEQKGTATRTFLFRSYNHPSQSHPVSRFAYNVGPPSTFDITDVANATAAAPAYFHPVGLGEGEDKAKYYDGGLRANNPSSLAFREVWVMAQYKYNAISQGHPAHPQTIPASLAIGSLVSIGTGKKIWQIQSQKRIQVPVWKYINMRWTQGSYVTDTVSACILTFTHLLYISLSDRLTLIQEVPHHEIRMWTASHAIPYFRFNVPGGLREQPLDEWKTTRRRFETAHTEEDGDMSNKHSRFPKMDTLTYIKAVTEQYLADEDETAELPQGNQARVMVKDSLQECASLLVMYRKAREKHSDCCAQSPSWPLSCPHMHQRASSKSAGKKALKSEAGPSNPLARH